MLGAGEDTPKKTVHHRSGRIVDGRGVEALLGRRRERAEWARNEGSGVDIRMEVITEDDASLVERIRATEAPLPTVTDRWGNVIPITGYGEGEYYRLSRQPIWLIRQLGQGLGTGRLRTADGDDGRERGIRDDWHAPGGRETG